MTEDTYSSTVTGVVRIDDQQEWPCEIEIRNDIEYVRSDVAVKPDPEWEFVDDTGHFHAFAEGGKLPTLQSERVAMPCDGSCGGVCEGEGYTVLRWTCRICGQEVEPGYAPDEKARGMGVPIVTSKKAQVKVVSTKPIGERRREVSLRVRVGDEELFGVGLIGGVNASGGPTGVRFETEVPCRFLEERLKIER